MQEFHTYTFTERFRELLMQWGFSVKISNNIVDFSGLFVVFVVSVIVYYILKFIINRFLKRLVGRTKSKWDDYLYGNKVFTRLCLIVPALIIDLFLTSIISDYPKAIHFIEVVLEVYTAAIMIIVANSFLNAVYHIYGDWMSMPSHNVDGTVTDISLVIVKVRNWDNSISTIPTYTLITESFQNWRDLIPSGGRRMKRFLLLDITSIKPCDKALLKKLEKYDLPDLVPGKSTQEQTNLGHFRYYLMDLLRTHPDVNQQMMILVRQMQPAENGLPLELTAYCLLSELTMFENFQATLFEHLIAVLPDFDLRLYQRVNTLLQ